MKIALCLSGQPRFFAEGYKFFYDNLLKNYDVDIFYHTWFNKEDTGKPYTGEAQQYGIGNIEANTDNLLVELYKPKKCIIETPYSPNSMNRDIKNEREKIMLSMFYSIKQANELKKQYEQENNFKYDCVIRGRFDSALMEEIRIEEYDLKDVNFLDILHVETEVVCDYFWFTNSENMDLSCTIYDDLETYIDIDNVKTYGENLTTYNCKKHNLNIKKQKIGMCLLRNNKPDLKFGKTFAK